MAVAPGTRVGVYEVTSLIGKGGMGVVFRARDTKLLRDVALKVLPDNFSGDPDRLARFQREAQVLASLNHPNIAQIYGLERAGDAECIVMEFVEGETLAERLKAGPLPLDELQGIAKQIADALAAAHERGVVHRDLKPANIKITPNGIVKVLDFGLAKVISQGLGETDPSLMPTRMSGSVMGAIVGTPAYMSPEQARGKEVDARTDIWAFGSIVYEMLTARQAFEAETLTDMFAKIVSGQPDLNALPATTPSSMRLLLAATLNKNVAERLQHIGDVRLFLDPKFFPTSQTETTAARPEPKTISGKLWIAGLVVALAVLIPVTVYFRPVRQAAAPQMRFDLTIPGLVWLSVSPNGQRLVYLAGADDGSRALWVRPIDSDAVQRLSGTEDINAFGGWSPDSRYVAFIAGGKLKKVDVLSGSLQTICDVVNPFRGLTWNNDGVMLLSHKNIVARVPDSGGEPKPLTTLDEARNESIHAATAFLPDGKHFLNIIISSVPENAGIFLGSLDDPKSRTRLMPLPERINQASYAQGHILFSNGPVVSAQPFDANRLSLGGKPVPVADDVVSGNFSVSETGLLFYRRVVPTPASRQLVWYDRDGRQRKVGAPANYGTVQLSPDGKRAAVDIAANNNRDVWVVDLERGVPTRITSDPASDWTPSWSPDGSRLIFASSRSGNNDIYSKAASGVGEEELVFKSDDIEIPVNWSHDGRHIVFSRTKSAGGNDTWLLQLTPEKKAMPFVESRFDKIHARVSPNGRWIAYASNDSGMYQIFVQSFPDPNAGRWQITADGGVEPKWARDGRELYYLALDGKLMAVPVKGDAAFEAGKSVPLLDTPLVVTRPSPSRDRRYDVGPDGNFLIVTPTESTVTPVTVLVNWTSGLEKK